MVGLGADGWQGRAMGKWNKHAPRTGIEYLRSAYPSDNLWHAALVQRGARLWEKALELLRDHGFTHHTSPYTGRFVVFRFGCMFEFEEATPSKVQEFMAWASSNRRKLSRLPAGILRLPVPKRTHAAALNSTAPIQARVPIKTTAPKSKISRGTGVLPWAADAGGLWDSTVPGHCAPLNWSDLVTR
jgi:hypothetical protein